MQKTFNSIYEVCARAKDVRMLVDLDYEVSSNMLDAASLILRMIEYIFLLFMIVFTITGDLERWYIWYPAWLVCVLIKGFTMVHIKRKMDTKSLLTKMALSEMLLCELNGIENVSEWQYDKYLKDYIYPQMGIEPIENKKK